MTHGAGNNGLDGCAQSRSLLRHILWSDIEEDMHVPPQHEGNDAISEGKVFWTERKNV